MELLCLLMVAHIAINIFPTEATEAFGGMYTTGPAAGVLKTILAPGTLIVMVQAKKIVLKNEKVELTLNTKGATVEKAVIKGYVGHNLQVKDGSADAKGRAAGYFHAAVSSGSPVVRSITSHQRAMSS